MKTIKISGHSDDIISIDGGDLDDEYPGGEEPTRVVLFPSHDVFRVVYGRGDDAVWVVEHEVVSGKLNVTIDRAPEGHDPEPYTDTARVTGAIERWTTWPPMADEIRERVDGFFDGSMHCAEGSEGLSDDQVARIWAIINERAK